MGVQTNSNDEPTLVRIEQGQLRGKVLSSVRDVQYFSYKGIPYAKPPIGELRFKVRLILFTKSVYICITSNYG